MKILIVYFTFTSNVQKLAEALHSEVERFGDVDLVGIESWAPHGYWGWLARSFIPRWRTPIKETLTDLDRYDIVFLGFPKWTLSCPPLNEYIKLMNFSRGKRIALFMSYGGFDQDRYLRGIVGRLTKKGARIVAVQAIKRSQTREATYPRAIRQLCRQAGLIETSYT